MNQTKETCSEKDDRTITFGQTDYAALMDKLGDLRSALYEGHLGNSKEACLKASGILQQVSDILSKGIISNNA